MQDEGDESFWCDFNRLSPELKFWLNGAVERVVSRANMKCADGRMMAHLLTHDSVAKTLSNIEMVRLTKQRVERLPNTIPVRRSCRHSKRCHQLTHIQGGPIKTVHFLRYHICKDVYIFVQLYLHVLGL